MKRANRIIAVMLSGSLLLTACVSAGSNGNLSVSQELHTIEADSTENVSTLLEDNKQDTLSDETVISERDIVEGTIDRVEEEEKIPDFYGMDDPDLLQYIEDTVYAGLVSEFKSEDYIIEKVDAIYYSQDYLQEAAYNSKANIWFGYTLAELDEQFQDESYVFTLGDDGQTVVTAFEDYDDTYDRVIRNVAIGGGAILICVTVSVVSGGLGAASVSMIFAASAKTGAIMALSSGSISAVVAGAITGIQTHDLDQVLKSAALQGSESFKWGAILGTISGGLSEANKLRNAPRPSEFRDTQLIDPNIEDIDAQLADPNISEWRKAELRAKKIYDGKEQKSYLGGKEVDKFTPGATRPDIVREVNNHLEAIEVKYYNLESSANRSALYNELEREVTDRVKNLPANSTQRVVLDVTGRNFSSETIKDVIETIQSRLFDIYGSNIPVDVVGA